MVWLLPIAAFVIYLLYLYSWEVLALFLKLLFAVDEYVKRHQSNRLREHFASQKKLILLRAGMTEEKPPADGSNVVVLDDYKRRRKKG